MDNKVVKIYNNLGKSYSEYISFCNELKEYINNKFDTDIIDDVLYQPSDGFVFLWNGLLNASIDIKEISKIKNLEELKYYLYNNSI